MALDARLSARHWPDLPPAEALQALDALVPDLRAAADLPSLTEALWWQGRLAGEQGHEAAAAATLQEALELAKRQGDLQMWAQAWMAQAWLDADFGHHARALTTCRQVADWARARGDDACVRQALFATATSLGHLGEHDLAVETFEEARMMLRSDPGNLSEADQRVAVGRYATGQAQAWLMRGGLLLEAGGHEAATEAFVRARTLSEQACEALLDASPRFGQPALFGLVRVLLEAGDTDRARRWVKRMADSAPLPPRGSLALAHARLCEAMIDLRVAEADPMRVLAQLADVDSVPHPRVVSGDLRLAQLRCLFEGHEQAGQYEQALACQQRWSEVKSRLRTRLAREHGLWSSQTLAAWRAEADAVVTGALRAPLRQAANVLEGASEQGSISPGETGLRQASHSLRRAIDIADQYLGVMRAEHMRHEDLQPLDLSALVDDVCEQMAPPAGTGALLVCLVERPLVIRGDRVLLMRALGNLLSNAIKHAPAGSQVQVTLRRQGGGVRLSVADQGCGLPLEMRARLFQRFATGAVRKGNGLGLAMVARVARVHQSRIVVDSEPGLGTTVSLLLEGAAHGA